MKPNPARIISFFIACLLVTAIPAHAQIVVTATLPGVTNTATAPALATSSTFDMNGGNAVALIVTTEASSGSATNMFASFAGQPMTLGAKTNQGAEGSFVFYLINPATTSGSFSITSSNSSGGLAYSAIALGNVGSVANAGVATAANTLTSGTTSLTNTIATNGGFVLSAAVNNGFNSGSPQPAFDPNSIANQALYPSTIVGSSGHLHLYGAVPTAGTYTQVYTNRANSGQRNAYVAIAFETADPLLFSPLSWAVGNGNWDINTATNWSNGVALVTYKQSFGIGSAVTFDDTASGSSPISVTLDTSVSPSSIIISNINKAYTISGSGSMGGAAALTKTGNETLTLSTANAFTGPVNLNGGTTVFSQLNNLGSGTAINFNGGKLKYNGNSDDISTRTITFNTNGATIDDGGSSITFNNPVGNNGAGGFIKTGSGTLTLGSGFALQSFNYHGNTVVSNGTLYINAYATLPNSTAIIVNAGAILDDTQNGLSLNGKIAAGAGTFAGPVTSSTGTITPGTNGVADTLTFSSSLSISGGSLILDVSTNISGRDLLIVSGALSISGGTVQLNVSGTLTNGTYKLIQYGSESGSAGLFTLTGYSQTGKSLVLSDATPGEIDLVVADTASDNIVWTGTAGSTWDPAGTLNWLKGATPWAYTNGDAVTFNPTGIANPNVSLQAALSPGSIVVSNDAGTTYTFVDGTGIGGGKITGLTSIVKYGAGTLTVGTLDQNTGPTIISSGTLSVSGSLGTGTITNNATLIFNQTANVTHPELSGTGYLTVQGSGSVTIGTGAAGGVLSAAGITNNGTLILNSSTAWNYNMPDTGAGNLRKLGANTLTLSGANTRTGQTRADGGKIILGNANQLKGSADVEAGATLDMNGFAQYAGGLSSTLDSGGRIVNNAGTVTNVLTVDTALTTDSSIVISTNDGTGGDIALVKTGVGTQVLRGASSYGGGTIISNGALRAVSSTAFGTGPVLLRGGNVSIYKSPTIANTFQADTNASFLTGSSGNATFTGSFTSASNLMFNLSGGETWTFNGGANQLDAVTGTIYIIGGSTDFFRFSGSRGSANAIFDLSGSSVSLNSVSAASYQLGALEGTGSSATLRGTGATTWVIGAKNLDTTYDGLFGSSSSVSANNLVKVGAGRLTLFGTNYFGGSTTISNGVLALGSTGSMPNTTNLLITAGATFDVSAIASYSLSTSNTLTANGAGTVVGVTAATITNAPGGTVDLGAQPISLTWGGGSTGTDSTHPALYVPQGTLNLSGNSITVVVPGTALGAGVYTLITAPAITGSVNPTPSFTGGNGLVAGNTGAISISGNSVILTVTYTAITSTWTNNVDGNWSVGANWSSNPSVPHNAGDAAILGASTALRTVTLDANESVGNLLMTNANSFVIADAGNTLTLDNSGSGAGVNVTNGTANVIQTAVALNDNATFSINGGSALAVTNIISGSGGLTKAGAGTLILSGTNSSYAGKTAVNGGTLMISADLGLGAVPGATVTDQLTLNGGTLSAPAGFTMNSKRGLTLGAAGGTIDVATGQSLSYGYLISGTGNLTKNGSGTLELSYSTTDHTYGNLTLNAGTVAINKSSGLGTGTVTINGGTIRADTATLRSPPNAVILNGDVTLGAAGTGNLNFTGPWTINGAARTITVDTITVTNAAAIGEEAAGRGLIKAGSGKLVLTATNTYTGNTTINAGILELTQTVPTLATSSTVSIASGAVLQLDRSSVTNVVAGFITNGVAAGAGLYNSANSSGFITSVGYLRVGAVGPSGPEHLTNSYNAGVLSLSWPAGEGWRLQINTNGLSSTNWVYITDGSSSTNITVDLTKPAVFYRLVYP